MRIIKNWLSVIMFLTVAINAKAYIPLGAHGKPLPNATAPKANFRAECATSKSQTDLEVNNVRARLQGGGDIWWDFKNGLYIVPKVAPGVQPVSSIFAGGVWIGGVTSGNLKTACTTYRNTGNDWFPGPLDPKEGTTDSKDCAQWDKHFRVTGAEITKFKAAYAEAKLAGQVDPVTKRVLDPEFIEKIPRGLKGWPSIGNPYFSEIWSFNLPSTSDVLAHYYDFNGDGIYDPMGGDYPTIFVRGCEGNPQSADDMVFWVYNDQGGGAAHTNSKGQPIRMEVQVQAFAYATNNELNNMTFMHYRLINRATETIDSMFFAMWVDADLGCAVDDYVGCDTTRGPNRKPRNLMYMYNQDDIDGNPGASCTDGVATYGANPPIVGVDYFRGPLDPRTLVKNPISGVLEPKEIGMSSFIYYNNGGIGTNPPATTDPQTVSDYYRYLNSEWKDGTPLTAGGSGYNITDPTAKKTKYALPGDPDDSKSWSMTNANLPFGDRRTIQASGPFPLTPGAVNELIVGVPWVPSQGGGKVSLQDIRSADDIAQDLFDSCFDIADGPDAPDLDMIELENELILVLTNNKESNNYEELYGKNDTKERPAGWVSNPARPSEYYEFEGYKIYQLAGPEVSYNKSLVDQGSDKIKLVAQVDISNKVGKIFNWNSLPDPNNTSLPAYYPALQVEGADAGLRHTFKVTKDLFAKSDNKTLINHRKYYFVAVAYGHNNFLDFDKSSGTGQKSAYIEGRKSAGTGSEVSIKTAIGIPRPIIDRNLHSKYGDGAVITRLDGIGIGGNFVDISDETRDAILKGTFKGEVVYKPGRGPISINIYNPLEVKDGDYELVITDNSPNDASLDTKATWKLTKVGETASVLSEQTIERLNEQIITKYGFSIAIAQSKETGADPNFVATNGVIGGELSYTDPKKAAWFNAIPDGVSPEFDFVTSTGLEDLGVADPKQRLSTGFLEGAFIPYAMAAYKVRTSPFASPAWHKTTNGSFYGDKKKNLANLNNVNIVFTPDKSKWSRCVVVETNNKMYSDDGLLPKDNTPSMALRSGKSIGSDTNPDAASDGTTGKSWFPGYAIDVETGKRLVVFFGENSAYDVRQNDSIKVVYNFSQEPSGGDMIWNPTRDVVAQLKNPNTPPDPLTASNLVAGCGHYIYVTDVPYENWKLAYDILKTNPTAIQNLVKSIRWTSMPYLAQNASLLEYKDGIIPNELTIKLRVDNPYQVGVDDAKGTGVNNSYPTYRFSIKGAEASALEGNEQIAGALQAIKVIPNPYYAYSAYENSQFSNTVKIANLPAKCKVTIYSLDGKFIRQYNRDESPAKSNSSNPGVNLYQVSPALEWDLKNSKGIPIAGGTYIIHITSDLGERTIKWFGVLRPFDPSGL